MGVVSGSSAAEPMEFSTTAATFGLPKQFAAEMRRISHSGSQPKPASPRSRVTSALIPTFLAQYAATGVTPIGTADGAQRMMLLERD